MVERKSNAILPASVCCITYVSCLRAGQNKCYHPQNGTSKPQNSLSSYFKATQQKGFPIQVIPILALRLIHPADNDFVYPQFARENRRVGRVRPERAKARKLIFAAASAGEVFLEGDKRLLHAKGAQQQP